MAKQRMKSETVKVTTPEFRAGFPNLFEARLGPSAKPGDKPKYSVTMLFQVTETAESKKAGRKIVNLESPARPDQVSIKALVRNILVDKFGTDRTKWPPVSTVPGGEVGKLALPFRSGEEQSKRNADETWKPGFGPGIIFAKADTMTKPGVVYPWADPANPKQPQTMTVPSDFYGGCIAQATINAYYWEYMGKMGISLSLQNVQKIKDDEPFGGRTAAEDEFVPIEQPAGAPVGAAAQATAAQPQPVASGGLGI